MMQQPTTAKQKINAWLQADAARGPALLFALLAALCLLYGLCTAPRLYPVDYGQYENLLPTLGLSYTQADLAAGGLQYERPLATFAYAHFSWMKLLSPAAPGSTVYAVAAVRLLTAPFGLPFSVDAMAFFWAVLLVAAVYCLLHAAWQRFGPGATLPGGLLCLIFTDGNFCALLRGLYPQGAAVVFTLLFAALLLRGFTTAAGHGLGAVLPPVLAAVLMLKSATALVVLLPGAVCALAVLLWREYHALAHRQLAAAVCAALLFFGCGSAVQNFMRDADYFSNAATYFSFFTTVLPAVPDASAALAEVGLDESYLPDVGRSFYEEESAYAHCPRDAAEAEALFAVLTPARVAGYARRHPALVLQLLQNQPEPLNTYQSLRNSTVAVGAAPAQTRAGGGPTALLRLLWPGRWAVWACCCLAGCLGCAALAACRRRLLPLLGIPALLGAAAYLPLLLVLGGYSALQQNALYQVFLQDMLLCAALAPLWDAAARFSAWLTRESAAPQTAWAVQRVPGRALRLPRGAAAAVHRLLGQRRAVTAAVAFIALFMVLYTEYKPIHAACVNNGDFGRMMQQLGITWTSDNYYDTASQVNHQAIEHYVWLDPFDWRRLTPLEPSYSLYLFASLFRIGNAAVGGAVSTYGFAVVMALLTAGCIALLTHDLYTVLGRWALPAGLGLCALFCGESYLVWYNGLYGESCVLMGLLLTTACAVHLAVMPRKGWRRVAWFFALVVSLYILVGAKAQMVMALPGAILLLGALLWYHRPYRLDYTALLCLVGGALAALLCVGAFGVYQSDRGDESVSLRHTMWQTYFYGIFMVSDDPLGDMRALGVDTAMAPDIGKYVDFSEDAAYVYAPLSDEAKTGFYDHVSMVTALQWYLTHPTKLLYMLNHAAQEAQQQYTAFRVYVGQDYTAPHDAVDGFGLWQYWRGSLAPGSFLGYAALYALLLYLAVRRIADRRRPAAVRMLWVIPLCIMLIGVLQFPLTVLGNGFADNQKQLFGFILCHDVLALLMLVLLARRLWRGLPLKTATAKPGWHKKETRQ